MKDEIERAKERLRELLADEVMSALRKKGCMWSDDEQFYRFKGKVMDLLLGDITL